MARREPPRWRCIALRKPLIAPPMALLFCVFLAGCTDEGAPSGADLATVEGKPDKILAEVKTSAPTASPEGGGDGQLSAKLEELLARIPASPQARQDDDIEQVSAKLDQLLARLPVPPPVREIDTSKLSQASTSDLAWILITNDPAEKRKLVARRIEQSSQHKSVGVEGVQALVNDLEGLNVIINSPEHLDLDVLQQVEDARNRLVHLLRTEIPGVVRKADEQAVKSTEFLQAKRLWAESSAILGFYPSSNDPVEAGKIQELVSAHDLVRTRIELLQQQRYNLWACQQIRKAWKDIEDNSKAGARMQTCLHFLGPIHPGLLDPVSLELYRDFLQTIRNKLSQELYQELSEKLAVEARKMLTDLKDSQQ